MNLRIIQKRKEEKGFTLIELLIGVAIFSLTIVAITALFSLAFQDQNFTLSSQDLLNQTSYAMEYMSRALRMATKELNCTDPLDPTTCSCLTTLGYGYNYEILDGGSRIRFINHLQNDDCQEFFLDTNNHQLKYQKDADNPSPPEPLTLTSEDIRVRSLKFDVSGEGQNDLLQPRVTILLEAEKKGVGGRIFKIRLQTSISQRNLDVPY